MYSDLYWARYQPIAKPRVSLLVERSRSERRASYRVQSLFRNGERTFAVVSPTGGELYLFADLNAAVAEACTLNALGAFQESRE